MLLNESEKQFANIITEEYGVKDTTKQEWMARLAQIHTIHESRKGISAINEGGIQPNNVGVANNIYATPLNTMGVGNPMMPQGVDNGMQNGFYSMGNTGADFHNPGYVNGSGDVPMSTLTTALEIAAVTIGFDLVPVVPASGPMVMLTFLDYPYAGGKLGKINETPFDGIGPKDENKPIYIKISGDDAALVAIAEAAEAAGQYPEVTVTSDKGTITGIYMGNSRIDNNAIIKVNEVQDKDSKDASIASIFSQATSVKMKVGEANEELKTENAVVRPELVKGVTDHIQSFSNFYGDGEGNVSDDPMTRAQNETGTGNTIGARMFSKMVQMGAYEATGAVTRQQLQDMPLYGIDVLGGIIEAMQNEISQAINNRILDRLFRLGVENYKVQKSYQGVDLNLFIGGATSASKALNQFGGYSKFVDLNNNTVASYNVPNAIQNTAAENITTHQRRIMSRLLAASNLIASVTRRGRANWAVVNAQVLTALQDCSQFVVAPMTNTLAQGGEESLYFAGTLAGLQIYVDPNMKWNDNRVCVGRKASVSNNKVNGSGVVFMPYILADQVQIVAEGTMAPKILMNSRFAVVDCGFYPEQNYYTFLIDFADSTLI